MSLSKINLKNFTVFKELEIEFSTGINVITGENGTGKTHLLKLLYSLFGSNQAESFEHLYFIDRLAYLFNTDIGLMDLSGTVKKDDNFQISLEASNDLSFNANFIIGAASEAICSHKSIKNIKEIGNGVFIPAKEMLSHSKGFLALASKYKIPFDGTHIDIITNAELPETKNISDLNMRLLETLSKIIGGTVVYKNDTFYVKKTNGIEVEFSLEAEGLRKFGLLWKLIRNGLLDKNTVLFWDEPEANINPKLIKPLVDILIEISKLGVQVFIATHSYFVQQEFSLYSEYKTKKENLDVKFISLYKDNTMNIGSETAKTISELTHNTIMDEFNELYNREKELFYED